jgi:FkbM family methyltransferase
MLRGIRRHPKALARVAMGLVDGGGWSAGRALADAMDTGGRRRAAAGLLRDERVVVRFRSGDLEWAIPSGDLILAEMLAHGEYESAEIPPLCDWVAQRRPIGSHPVVVEVGANVGTSTIPFCQLGYRVVAFEPVPRIRALLEENLSANGYRSQVEVLPYAVAATDGTAEMRVSDAGGSELVSAELDDVVSRRGPAYISGRQAEAGRTAQVSTRTLTSALAGVGVAPRDVAVVWSDTEGAETGVIAGGAPLWGDGVPLWLEVWPAGLEEHGGLDAFTQVVRTHFRGFLEREVLMDDGRAAQERPVTDLGPWLHTLLCTEASWASTDLLLVPTSMRQGEVA